MNCWATGRIFIMSALICSTTAETKGEDDVCKTTDCMKLGLELSDAINASVDPCDDFYDYVCKKWKKKNKIPPYLPSYGHLWLIRDEVAKKINDTLSNMTVTTFQAESLNEKIAMAYQSCMREDLFQPAEEIKRLKNTLKRFGILEWPMMPSSKGAKNWQEIYRKMRIGADMSFIFNINLTPNLTNTSVRAIDIDVSEFLHTLDELYQAQDKKESAVKAYEDFIKRTVILFSGEKDINVTTKIAQDIFDFEVNLTRKINDFELELPHYLNNISTDDYYSYYEDLASSTESELVRGRVGSGAHRVQGLGALTPAGGLAIELQARSDESTSAPEKDPEPSTKLKDIDRILKSGGWRQLLTDVFKDASVNLTGEEEVNAFDQGFLKGAMKLLNETSG